MKQFIVLLAVFPLMMAFIVQFTLQQNMDYRLELVNEAVYDAKEAAKVDGYFPAEKIESLRYTLSEIAGCEPEEVTIDVSEDIKYRTNEFDERELISCNISLPVGRIMAFPVMFGMGDEENVAVYSISDEFPSERLR